MTFVSIDEKTECIGYYKDGNLILEEPSFNTDRTWKYRTNFKDKNYEYANLYVGGKTLADVCPETLKPKWDALNKKLEAHLNAISEAKISLEDYCVFDLLPRSFLLEFCSAKSKIIDNVFLNNQKPENYDFFLNLEKMLVDISTRKIKYDKTPLLDLQHDASVRKFTKDLDVHSKFVEYNQFGTKTGRLTTKKNSFPILTLKSSFRDIIKPNNDFFIEIDINAAELRVLLYLAGMEQPKEDIHAWNAERLGLSREEAKQQTFAWIYGSSQVDTTKFENLYDTKRVLDTYYDGEKIKNPFNRTIQCDRFHALNYLCQSTASDLVLRQCIKIHKKLENKKTKLGFIVHDNIVLDVSNDELSLCNELVDTFANGEFGFFPVRVSIGKSYGNLKKIQSKVK